jgi:hypothetical protein
MTGTVGGTGEGGEPVMVGAAAGVGGDAVLPSSHQSGPNPHQPNREQHKVLSTQIPSPIVPPLQVAASEVEERNPPTRINEKIDW